jgi:S1-C subfamily serine protease
MSDFSLAAFSNQLADAVAAIAPSVVQVQGRRRPASGLVYATDVVLATARALGREDGLHVRTHDGRTVDAELAGWDPATGLVVLRAPGLGLSPVSVAAAPARVGQLAIAVARSWSNAVTASMGVVSVIGGPLPTWHGRRIEQVIRTSAPMHEGFSGGAFADASGALVGVATAAKIRDLGVVIPSAIAWKTAASLLEHGSAKRGFLGISSQPVKLSDAVRGDQDRAYGLLVSGVVAGSPADRAGVLVGDVVLDFDGTIVQSPVDLLELLHGDRVGRDVPVRITRGGQPIEIRIAVGTR